MNSFAYDGAWRIEHLVIVGVGGTGSALTRLLARILWGREQAGQSVPMLHLVDPDVVELKNVLRQGFAPADVGNYKCQALARRYSLAYGLPIHYVTEAFDPDKHLPSGSILIDCTDNHLARRAIVKGILDGATGTAISCGNARTHGQVTIGSCGDRVKLFEAIEQMESEEAPWRIRNGPHRPCYHLPHFGLLYPELLASEPQQLALDASCAELAAIGEQHPLINETMAMVCAGYLFKLLHRQPVTTFLTEVDLHNLSVTSTPITPETLRTALALS